MPSARVDLTLDSGPFVAGLNEAERRSQSFEQRVGGLFKRSPLARAERAFTDLAANLSSGNVAQGVAGFATRISGLGLAAGIGIGAAVTIFERFRGEVEASDLAARKLGAELATLGGTRGPQELAQKFQAITAQTEDLIQKSHTAGNAVANILDKFVNPALGTSSRGRGADQAAEITAGLSAAGKTLADRAAAERRIVEIKEEGLTVSTRQATIDEALNAAAIKKTQIDEEAAKFKLGLFAPELRGKLSPEARDKLISDSQAAALSRKSTVDRDAQVTIEAADQIAAIKDHQLDLEQAISAAALEGASAEQLKMMELQGGLKAIDDQLATSKFLTAEGEKQLQTERLKAQVKVRDAQLGEFLKPAGQRQQEAIAAATQRERIKQFERATGIKPVVPGVQTEEAKAKIADLNRQIEAIKAPDRPVVPAVLTDEAKAKVDELQRKIDSLNTAARYGVDLQISTADASAKIKQLQDQKDAILPEGMPLNLLTDEAKAKLADLDKQIAGLASTKLKPDISVEEAKTKIADLKARIEILTASPKNITPKAQTDEAKAKIKELQNEINKLTGKTVKIGVDTGKTPEIGYAGQMPRFDISGNLTPQIPGGTRTLYGPYGPPPGMIGPTHPDAYGVLGEPSPKTGHVYQSQLDALSRHMEPLAPGMTTGTGPSDTWRSMFPPRDVLGPQPTAQPPGTADTAVVAAIKEQTAATKEQTNLTKQVWGN
jgi:hypothetical protein